MNQEQNNLNSNNFNTQGNNGISNNQLLQNNQSLNNDIYQNLNVNQPTFNPQPQPTSSFQQPIMQEPMPQPVNNTFEGGNASNQNLNNKPPKKMNLGLIIGIVIAVVIVVIGFVFGSKLLSNSGNGNNSNNNENNNEGNNVSENNKYQNEDVIYDVHKITDPNDESITKLTFTYNGQTLTYPFTLKDVENLGLLVDDIDKTKQISANSGMGGITVFTGSYTEENKITLNVFNETENTLSSSDCIVNYISTTNTKVSVNGITPGKTNYKNILEKFGRDNDKRKNTFYNENLRQINEGSFSSTMNYSSQNENFLWCYLEISLGIDYDNNTLIDKVHRIVYKQGR